MKMKNETNEIKIMKMKNDAENETIEKCLAVSICNQKYTFVWTYLCITYTYFTSSKSFLKKWREKKIHNIIAGSFHHLFESVEHVYY